MGVFGLNTDRETGIAYALNDQFQAETGHLRHTLFQFLSKEFGHPSSREQCHLSPAWNA